MMVKNDKTVAVDLREVLCDIRIFSMFVISKIRKFVICHMKKKIFS